MHCCPHTTICDLAHGRCLSPTGDGDIPLGTAFPAWKRQPPAPGKGCPPRGGRVPLLSPWRGYRSGEGTQCHHLCVSSAVALHEVLCPDGRSACPDGATCCQLPSAQYGCCPLQNVSAGPTPGTPCWAPSTRHPVPSTLHQPPNAGHPMLDSLSQKSYARHPVPTNPHQAPHTKYSVPGTRH